MNGARIKAILKEIGLAAIHASRIKILPIDISYVCKYKNINDPINIENDTSVEYDIIKKIGIIINKSCDKIKPSYLIDNRPLDTKLIDTKYDIIN